MGTTDFIEEILAIFAALDRPGKQKLIDYSTQLVADQRVEQPRERHPEQRLGRPATA